jgi:predicted permease
MTETLLLFSLGAVPGVLLAGWGAGSIETLFREGRRAITVEADLNWRVLAFSLTVTLLAGLVSSLFPVWRAFRTDPQEAIKEGQDRTTEGRGAMMLTQTLVAFQVALAFVLLVGSFTFVGTLANLRSVDPGFRNEDVLTMSVQLPEGYADASTFVAFWNRALETVRGLPGVRAAGISTFTPLSGRNRGALVRVRGYEPATSEDAAIHINQVSEGYFESLGIPLLRGRLLTAGDAEGTTKVALINQSAARKYFGERDPIGERLEFPRKEADSTYRIAGVVGDTKHMNLRETSAPFAFISLRQPRDLEQRVTLVVASSVEDGEAALLQPVRNGLVTIDPGILISDVITIRRQLDSTLLTERLLSGLSSAFGLLALVVASIGLYGILSYRIGRERQSIGIRMALGASPSSVALTVLRRSGAAIATGLLAGLPFAFVAARMADTMLWGVKAGDPMIYISCAALLCAAGIASAYVPARRASAIAPAEALRHG